jgi:hypothetical protein
VASRTRPIALPELNPLGDLVLCKRGGGYGHRWDECPWPDFLDYDRFDIGYPMSERCERCASWLVVTYTPRMQIINRYYYHSLQYRKVLDAELTTEDIRIHRVARSKNMAKRLAERNGSR